MDHILNQIDNQIKLNQGKNLLYEGDAVLLKLSDETLKVIAHTREPELTAVLIDYTTDKVIEAFCSINQYYAFSSEARKELRTIYRDLATAVQAGRYDTDTLAQLHYGRLKQWLIAGNPFAVSLYAAAQADLTPVACAEYSAETQLHILKIDTNQLLEPILDIGCGKGAHLVRHLRGLGLDAQGMDRYSFSENFLRSADWLEFDYGARPWGTIISNLAFSNHFMHHNLRQDGNYMEYAGTYMDILHALKPGGCFHYAPGLPFIETYLDNTRYQLTKHTIGSFEFKTTVIKRLTDKA